MFLAEIGNLPQGTGFTAGSQSCIQLAEEAYWKIIHNIVFVCVVFVGKIVFFESQLVCWRQVVDATSHRFKS